MPLLIAIGHHEEARCYHFCATTVNTDPSIQVGLTCDWSGSAAGTESTIHQLSPYVGKIKSSIAASLIRRYSRPSDIIFDPFAGSGTIPMEAWVNGRSCIATDLSPYAQVLIRAKLFPPASLDEALKNVARAAPTAHRISHATDLRLVPRWVRSFFHTETLREAIAWSHSLRIRRDYFTLAALLGILHHQRPGFLSFPSSHTTPYLRTRSFPPEKYPELYEYRDLRSRLEAKLKRAFRRLPTLDASIPRYVARASADRIQLNSSVDMILTSPPYMRLLDYGRDNRLRLWFLGERDWNKLDSLISPGSTEFLKLMRRCLVRWSKLLKPGGYCILVLGNTPTRSRGTTLPCAVELMATKQVGGYYIEDTLNDLIPAERRTRRTDEGSSSETIMVLKKI